MAETDQIPHAQVKETPVQKLKYLEFVQIVVLHVVIYVSKVYDYAKDNSGPLKTGVQTVEGTVKAVVGPVYQKYHGVPIELLKFFDRKVGSFDAFCFQSDIMFFFGSVSPISPHRHTLPVLSVNNDGNFNHSTPLSVKRMSDSLHIQFGCFR